MPAPVVLAFVFALAVPPDTLPATAADTTAIVAGPVSSGLSMAVRAVADTVPRRRRAVELSEWYERRLRIHRYGSYAMYPLFVVQAVAGNQVYQNQQNAPDWAKTGHRVGAAGLATVFTLNTVTGLWNLWDSRSQPEGRGRRTAHALLMLASDAGFTYAGVRLSEQAEGSQAKRKEHRAWAYGSMATALTGVSLMTVFKER